MLDIAIWYTVVPTYRSSYGGWRTHLSCSPFPFPCQLTVLVIRCAQIRPQAKESNRRFLKQALEIVLTGLHVKACQYQESLAVAQPLIRELKKFDDKLQLVEVQLIESRACEDPPRSEPIAASPSSYPPRRNT